MVTAFGCYGIGFFCFKEKVVPLVMVNSRKCCNRCRRDVQMSFSKRLRGCVESV